MADVSHLERMGRELKCPICLSLLNSAVSLTCNHAFCDTCIEKSMKSASNCPVCKIPFRRREIRPAPHMDNLVNVYKSMEAASGVDIFVTQNAAPTKTSGEDNKTDHTICKSQDVGETQMRNLDTGNHKQHQRNGSNRESITSQRAFGSNSTKPSFPTKKRVQVPPYPTSETQVQPEKVDGEIDRNGPQMDHVLDKNTASLSEKREPNFTPFFWLREEADIEKLSQQTDSDQETFTPPEAPCFSDIKELDDDVPCKTSPKDTGTCEDFFDSEMFDWTQRPCSPELCSSSLAMQIEDTADGNGVQESTEVAFVEATKDLKISPKKVKSMGKRGTGKTSGNKVGMRMCNKRVCNAIEKRQSKKTKTTEVTALHNESGKVINQDILEKSSSKESVFSSKGKTRKNRAMNTAAEFFSTQSDGMEPHAKSKEMALVDTTASPNAKKSVEGSKSKRSGRNGKKTNAHPQTFGSKVKAGERKTISDQVNVEQPEENLISPSNNNLLPLGNDKGVSDEGTANKTCERKLRNRKKMSRSLKKVKLSIEGSKENHTGRPVCAVEEAAVRGETFQETQGGIDQSGMITLAKIDQAIPTLNNTVLVKCRTLTSAIHCAFCQTSKESEASGMMVHYLNGKLVTDFDNTTSNALHVHKYCTEWAPNVYFEDDNVINLENELSRSRRITCSCCGKKGAALGCYEKSCRRSFHVPCARLTPKFRWDYENFVMLCPNHASCQLPNETTKPQSKQRRKSATESKSHHHIVKATNEVKSSSILQLKSQKGFKNLVLCCSALTNTEKEIVKDFEGLSGVTTLKNWDSSVTHVIASTDENGACRRTLKFLMGVIEGKWILSVHWLKACMAAGELVDEQPYEIAVDIHGVRDGPRLGRLRFLNKQPKLFDGSEFFFVGDFTASYKGYLHDLIIAAGGKVLYRKPIVEDQAGSSSKRSKTTYIVYSVEFPEKCRPSDASRLLNSRVSDAKSVANSTGSVAASNSWILNSIAGHKVQDVQK